MTSVVRLKAFLIHLGISFAVGVIALLVVFLVWYPHPFQVAVGVTSIFLIVLGVDVTVGPLLTLLVYKPGKKSLRFDLTVIAILQLAAFSYGMLTVADGRPAWLVFSVDRFELVQAYQVDTRRQKDASSPYRQQPWLGPEWAAARRAESREERNTILMESLMAGVDIAQRPERYVDLSEQVAAIRSNAKSLDELRLFNPAGEVEEILHQWPEADAYLPMMARVHSMTVLINKSSAKVVAVVNLRPWQE